MNVPWRFWGEAVRFVVYLMNRTSSRVIDFKTPYQKLHELVNMQINYRLEPIIFECATYVHQNIGKLEPREIMCIFWGMQKKRGIDIMTQSWKKCMWHVMHPFTRPFNILEIWVLFRGRNKMKWTHTTNERNLSWIWISISTRTRQLYTKQPNIPPSRTPVRG